MEKQKTPFAVHAARWSVTLPVVIIAINLILRTFDIIMPSDLEFVISCIIPIFYIAGIVLAIIALCKIKIHGPRQIRGTAITGLVLNGLILVLLAISVPALMKVRNLQGQTVTEAQFNDFMSFVQNNLNQIQTNGTIQTRTFTVKEDGPLAPLMQLVNDGMIIQAEAGLQYDQKIAHIDLASYLEPENLLDPNSLNMAFQNTQFMQTAYQEFMLGLAQKTDAHYTKFRDLNIPQKVRSGFLDGYLESKVQNMKVLEQLKGIHFDYMQSLLDLFAFMQEKHTACSLEEGYMVFDEDADYEQFNQLYNRMTQLESTLLNYANQTMEDIHDEIDQFK